MIKLYKKTKPYLFIFFFVFFTSFIVWLPFVLRQSNWLGLSIENSNFLYVYRHYDGLLYVIAAKTLYNIDAIRNTILDVSLPDKYFAAHLPLYPLIIRFFYPVFGYMKSMIFVNIASTVVLAAVFYHILVRYKLTEKPIILTLVFLMLPRFLVVRSIGAPESLFIALILLSLFFFEKRNYIFSGLFGGLAVVTKTPAVLLLPVYLLALIERWKKTGQIDRQASALFMIPVFLLGVFFLYERQMGDFFAYFHSGDNIHFTAPFSAFNYEKIWVGTAWLEDILFYFFIYSWAVYSLKDIKYRSFFYFGLVFLIAVFFIEHRDIARYSLPLWPLACIAFERLFTSRKFLVVATILLPAIYMYVWNFMLYNVMPVSNWAPFR